MRFPKCIRAALTRLRAQTTRDRDLFRRLVSVSPGGAKESAFALCQGSPSSNAEPGGSRRGPFLRPYRDFSGRSSHLHVAHSLPGRRSVRRARREQTHAHWRAGPATSTASLQNSNRNPYCDRNGPVGVGPKAPTGSPQYPIGCAKSAALEFCW